MRDETEALKWLQRAAAQGHAEAQPYFGVDGCFTEQRFEGRKVVPQGRHGHVITVIVEADVRTLAQVLATA